MIKSLQFLPGFFDSLIIELSILIFTLLIGIVALSIFKRDVLNTYKNLSELFISIFLGVVIIGIFTALILAKGKTIFIFSPLLAIILFRATKFYVKPIQGNQQPRNLKPGIWIPLLLGVNILAFFITYYFLIFKTNGGINCDQVFYGQVSHSLAKTGVETINFSWLRESENLIPYHYLELWFVGFTQKIFNLGPGAYVLIWYPISITLLFFGIAVLTETLIVDLVIANHRIRYIVSGVLCFFILLPAKKIFLGTHNSLDDLKAALATSLMILIYYSYIKRGVYLALFISLAMIFIYPSITPAVYTGAVSVAVYLMANRRKELIKQGLLLISSATVFVFLFLGLYFIEGFFSSHYLTYSETSHENLTVFIFNLFFQFGEDLIRLFIYFIPFLILLVLITVLSKSRNVIQQLIKLIIQEKVILIFMFSGLFFSKIVSLIGEKYNPEFFQNYLTFYDILVHLTLFSLIIWIAVKYLKVYKGFFVSFSLFFFLYFSITLIKTPSPHFFKPSSDKFKPEFWSEVYTSIDNDHRNFVFIPNELVVRNDYEKNNLLVYPLQRMIWIKSNYYPLNLTESLSSFNNEQDSTLSFLKELNFITENNIGFIILENGAFLNPLWKEFIKKSITGEDYCLLCLNDIKSIN